MTIKQIYKLFSDRGHKSITVFQCLEGLSRGIETVRDMRHDGIGVDSSLRHSIKILEDEGFVKQVNIEEAENSKNHSVARRYQLTESGKKVAHVLNYGSDAGLLMVLAHIRAIAGDAEGRLMLDDFVAKVGSDYKELAKYRRKMQK